MGELKIESIHLQIIFKSMVINNTMQGKYTGGAKAGKYEKGKVEDGYEARETRAGWL